MLPLLWSRSFEFLRFLDRLHSPDSWLSGQPDRPEQCDTYTNLIPTFLAGWSIHEVRMQNMAIDGGTNSMGIRLGQALRNEIRHFPDFERILRVHYFYVLAFGLGISQQMSPTVERLI